MKQIITAIALCSLISGCTVPVYSKSVTYKYDAAGNYIGKEVTEAIAQQDPQSSPMKVGITKKNEIEK